MILVDTGVWIEHFKTSDPQLSRLLGRRRAFMHPFVLAELMLGGLPRGPLLNDLKTMPRPDVASFDEVLVLIGAHGLSNTGIGYVDAHLVASCLLRPGAVIWTGDRKLKRVAERLGVEGAPKAN